MAKFRHQTLSSLFCFMILAVGFNVLIYSAINDHIHVNVVRVNTAADEHKHEHFKVDNNTCNMYSHALFWSSQGYLPGAQHMFRNIMGLNNHKMVLIMLLHTLKMHIGNGILDIFVLPKCEISYPECQPLFSNEQTRNHIANDCNVSRSFSDFGDTYDESVWRTRIAHSSDKFTFWSLQKFEAVYKFCNYSADQLRLRDSADFYDKYFKLAVQTNGNYPLMLTGLSALKPHQSVVSKVHKSIESMNNNYFALQARVERDMKRSRFHRQFSQFGLAQILAMINRTLPWPQLQSFQYLFIAVGPDIDIEDRKVIQSGVTPWHGTIVVSDEIARANNYSYQVNAMFDYEICLKAKVFIGTHASSFSYNMALQRNYKLTFDYSEGTLQTWLRPQTFAPFNVRHFAHNLTRNYSFPYI